MVEVIQDFIRPGRRNRPGHPLKAEWITVHDTGNPKAGADALAHAKYLHGNAADLPASWHFTVDDKRAVQHLPLDENGWHAGDGANGPGNRTSIGVEICENQDGDRAQAERNAQELVADLLTRLGLTLDRVVPHKRWNGKNCPHLLLPRWDAWVSGIAVYLSRTPIIGPPQATVEQAQEWARRRGATQQFISLAPPYWKYGVLYGIRPEVMYAQAAKETAFGRFGGAVTPDMHNFAGIKVLNPKGDAREDHESFPDDETGVHAHYQHMSAYVGLASLGEKTHPRQDLVRKLPWAGSIRYVEELGGRWAPSTDYGRSIVRDYLESLLATSVPPCIEGPSEVERLRARVRALEEKLARIKAVIEEA